VIIFDIETEALPLDQIEIPPFDMPADLPAFDPASVKTGNLKDAAKIQEKIDQAKAAHESAMANYPKTVEAARADHVAKFLDKAALSAHTGRVLCIGYLSTAKDKVMIDDGKGDESEILLNFWKQFGICRLSSQPMVGLNIHDFDLPFIARRSWMLGIDVPPEAFDGRYWDRIFVDLRERWLCGQRSTSCESNFDAIAKALGTAGKNGQSGADFAKLWIDDRPAAIDYLTNDLRQPAVWAARMGLIYND
jgi:hypothetical protein